MDDPLSILIVFLIGLVAAFIFLLSLAEAALLGVSRQLLQQRAEEGDRRAQLVSELVSGGDYLSTLIVGINVGLIVIATLATVVVHRSLGPGHSWQHELVHLATIAVLLAFAELTPKTYGSLYANDVALMVGPFVLWLNRLFAAPVAALTRLADAVLRLMHAPSLHERRLVTEEDIMAATDLGEETGVVEAETGKMLDAAIELKELTARDVMVPRVDVVGVSEDASLEEVLEKAETSGFTRLPVYRESLDNIVGVIHVNDLMRCLLTGEDWHRHIYKPLVVAESTPLADVFRTMRNTRTHMAIVADEYGGTAGIVTMEDILEELVGEIRDEHDRQEAEIVEVGPQELVVDGSARIEDVYQRIDREPPELDADTVAGMLFELTGHIPSVGEQVEHEGVTFVVEQSDGQRIERVRVVAQPAKQGGER